MQGHSNRTTYLYYKLYPCKVVNDINKYEFVCKRPPISNAHQLIWTVFSLGKYRRWELIVNGETVSTAEVMTKMPFYCFMPNNGIHIGPCQTKPLHRGNGYYPILLSKIVASYFPVRCYIFCSEANLASVRGINKAGGVVFANGHRTKFGFYIIDNKYE